MLFIYKFSERLLNVSRDIRSKYLGSAVDLLIKTGITANHITFLSLVFGLMSAYFLADKFMFISFGLLHLFLDSFDGAIARKSIPTKSGIYFDTIADSFVAVSLSLAAGGYIASILHTIHQSIYLLSCRRTPVLFGRTVLLILFAFGLYKLGIAYLAGVSIIGLLLQLYHFTFLRPK